MHISFQECKDKKYIQWIKTSSNIQLNDILIFRFLITAEPAYLLHTLHGNYHLSPYSRPKLLKDYLRGVEILWWLWGNQIDAFVPERESAWSCIRHAVTDTITESTRVIHHPSHLARTAQSVAAIHLINKHTHKYRIVHTHTKLWAFMWWQQQHRSRTGDWKEFSLSSVPSECAEVLNQIPAALLFLYYLVLNTVGLHCDSLIDRWTDRRKTEITDIHCIQRHVMVEQPKFTDTGSQPGSQSVLGSN